MKPLISIITPMYNCEKFVEETVESLINQNISKKYFEAIFVNDGSTDESLKIVSRRIKGFDNFKTLSKKNGGSASAKNFGCFNARGKYIALLDGDDFLELNALEETLKFMEEHSFVKYSYSQHRRVNEKGDFICDRKGYPFSRKVLLHKNIVGAIECFEKELFVKVKGFRNVYAEDYDFALRASEILEDSEISRNEKIIYNYRIHGMNKNIIGLESSRKSTAKIIEESLQRKEKINVEVFWSHMTQDKYNYYNWEEIE